MQQLTNDANNEGPPKVSHESGPVSPITIPSAANHGNQSLTELSESIIKTLA